MMKLIQEDKAAYPRLHIMEMEKLALEPRSDQIFFFPYLQLLRALFLVGRHTATI
jgi:hypothetical protein